MTWPWSASENQYFNDINMRTNLSYYRGTSSLQFLDLALSGTTNGLPDRMVLEQVHSVFHRVPTTWESPWVDLPSSDKNHQLPMFYSANPSPLSSWSGSSWPRYILWLHFGSAKFGFSNLMDLLLYWYWRLVDDPDLLRNSVMGMFYPDMAKLELYIHTLVPVLQYLVKKGFSLGVADISAQARWSLTSKLQ